MNKTIAICQRHLSNNTVGSIIRVQTLIRKGWVTHAELGLSEDELNQRIHAALVAESRSRLANGKPEDFSRVRSSVKGGVHTYEEVGWTEAAFLAEEHRLCVEDTRRLIVDHPTDAEARMISALRITCGMVTYEELQLDQETLSRP